MQALILGTPGIGKSVFLTFLMWSIIQSYQGQDITIVYRNRYGPCKFLALMNINSKEVDSCVIDPNDTAPDRFRRAAGQAKNWVLLDSCGPLGDPDGTAHGVMVTSPRATMYNEYSKYGTELWMPVWDWTELSDCRLKVFKNTISQEWLECVAEVSGPIPRLVFNAAASDANARVLQIKRDAEKSMAKDLNQLSRIVDEVSGTETVNVLSHRIVHSWVPDNFCSQSDPTTGYRTHKVRFASPWVEKTVMDRLVKAQLNDIRRLVSGKTADEDIRKIVFESWAHVTIPLGGQQYKIRRLDGVAAGTESVVSFAAMTTRSFWNLREFVQETIGEW